MTSSDRSAPITTSRWALASETLLEQANVCTDGERRDSFLRRVRDHLDAGPNAIYIIVGELPDAEAFAALLSLGAVESAARKLVDHGNVGYLISRGAGSNALVTMSVPGAIAEVSHNAPEEAVAFAAALLKLLQQVVVGRPLRGTPALRDVSRD